ncbi:hypothetical protein QP265_12200 [Escherichia coli]|nr:hypothetical protein [Escherichia coli]
MKIRNITPGYPQRQHQQRSVSVRRYWYQRGAGEAVSDWLLVNAEGIFRQPTPFMVKS